MAKVVIYSADYCGYCTMAKRLLDARSVPYVEHDVTDDFDRRKWLIEVTGKRTVPQIFFGDYLVGGFDELAALDRSGNLAATLEANA